MKLENLTGGAAVGTAFVVWFVHGGDYSVEEVVAMSAGASAVVTFLVGLFNRFVADKN